MQVFKKTLIIFYINIYFPPLQKSVPVIYPQQTAAQMVSCPQHLPISPDYHEGFLWPQLFVSSLPTHDQPPTNHKLLASYNK